MDNNSTRQKLVGPEAALALRSVTGGSGSGFHVWHRFLNYTLAVSRQRMAQRGGGGESSGGGGGGSGGGGGGSARVNGVAPLEWLLAYMMVLLALAGLTLQVITNTSDKDLICRYFVTTVIFTILVSSAMVAHWCTLLTCEGQLTKV